MPEMISGPALLTMLPRDLRGELCLVGIALNGRGVTFRMDPGRAFERRGAITGTGGGRYEIGIADRHLPGDPLADVAGTAAMRAADVPDELRRAASDAWTRAAAWPHWRDTLDGTEPELLSEWPGPAASHYMSLVTERTAEDTTTVCFLYCGDGWTRCATAPPRDTVTLLSVTPQGEWSLHHGLDTYPLTGHPDGPTLAAVRTGRADGPRLLQAVRSVPHQVRLARVGCPDFGPPAIAPVQRGPTRTSDQARPDQRRRRGQ